MAVVAVCRKFEDHDGAQRQAWTIKAGVAFWNESSIFAPKSFPTLLVPFETNILVSLCFSWIKLKWEMGDVKTYSVPT